MLAVAALIVFCSANAMTQNLKIGIVDIETIVSELPEAKAAEEALNDLGTKYQDSLVQMRDELQERLAAYQKQQAMMPDDQKAKEEESLQMMNLELQQMQQKHFGPQGTLAMKREQLLEPIRKKVKKAIEDVAKTEKISIVLDQNDQIVLYSEQKMDITFRVLDQLKRGSD